MPLAILLVTIMMNYPIPVRALTTSLSPVADTTIDYPEGADTNFGGSDTLSLSFDYDKWSTAMVEFDTSGIPSGLTVLAARLILHLANSTGIESVPIHVYKINETWSENTTTWNNKPSTLYGASGFATVSNATGNFEWNITSLVQNWVDLPAQNHGLMFGVVYGDANFYRGFSSRESGLPPILQVTVGTPSVAFPSILSGVLLTGIALLGLIYFKRRKVRKDWVVNVEPVDRHLKKLE